MRISVGEARGRGGQQGLSFVELIVALSVVGVAILVMLQQLSLSFREAREGDERAFAYEKATGILAEIQNGILSGVITDALALDELADDDFNPHLTTLRDTNGVLLPPDHEMSNNLAVAGGGWAWARRIDVETVTGQPRMRYVRVKLFHRQRDGGWTRTATVGSLFLMPLRAFQPTKVYDVYVLALGSAPSLWRPIGELRAAIETAAQAIETIEKGLEFRLHWITRAGYGRDPLYAPYLNSDRAATAEAPFVYWYPAKRAAEAPPIYERSSITARLRTETGFDNDYDPGANPYPYAVADRFNHCMRLPDARELRSQRLAAGMADEAEPTLRLLLEDMASDPDRYRNAIVVNLHGDALPMPPLRNYSDAARDPEAFPGVRVVTHPARLRPNRHPTKVAKSEDCELRVYAYKTDPAAGTAVLTEPITVQIMGLDLTAGDRANPSLLEIRRLPGGVDRTTGLAIGPDRDYFGFDDPEGDPWHPGKGTPREPYEMYYEIGYVGGAEPYTWIKLYNTPLVAPEVGGRGLPAAWRLYGMEYVPSPVRSAKKFDLDLASGGNRPKNTARWRLRIRPAVFQNAPPRGFGANEDQRITVVTRIGDDLTTGVAWPTPNKPHDVSRTYVWWASSPDAVPWTERYQILGDPRHNPYLDLCNDGSSFPDGYDWHFDDLRDAGQDATTEWPCLDAARLQDGFAAGFVGDAPRLLQLLRGALQRSGAIWVNPSGGTARALLLGGEIAAPPAAPLEPPTPVSLAGKFLGAASAVQVDTVTPPGGVPDGALRGRHVVRASGGSPFWAKPWLGELFPDEAYTAYLTDGNLACGPGVGQFHRELRSLALLPGLPAGTAFAFPSGATLGAAGSVAFLDSGTLASTFVHEALAPTEKGNLSSLLEPFLDAVAEELPQTITAAAPFGLDRPFPGVLPYFGFTADYPKSTATLLEPHYERPTADGLVVAGAVANRAGPGLVAFSALSGATPVSQAEHEAAGRGGLLLGLRTFHRAGEPDVDGRIVQTPLLQITSPGEGVVYQNPTSIELVWSTPFLRFDGNLYTLGYPEGFSEPESDLVYTVLYSPDEGENWFRAFDGQPARIGEWPQDPAARLPDAGLGAESFALATPPERFLPGDYVLRVECHHASRRQHYAYHQIHVKIQRGGAGNEGDAGGKGNGKGNGNGNGNGPKGKAFGKGAG